MCGIRHNPSLGGTIKEPMAKARMTRLRQSAVLIAASQTLMAAQAIGQPAAGLASQESSGVGTTGSVITVDSARLTVALAQNAILREYHAHLLSTVYWSLGTLAIIAGLLLGFGWYVNLRVYDRDKLALRQELHGQVAEDIAKAVQSMSASIDERMTERERQVAATAKSAAQAVHSQLRATANELSKQIARLEMKAIEQEAENWRIRKVPTNELRASISLVNSARKVGWDWMVSRALDRMHQCFRNGVKLDAQLSSELVEVLDALPPQYTAEVQSLKDALLASRQSSG